MSQSNNCSLSYFFVQIWRHLYKATPGALHPKATGVAELSQFLMLIECLLQVMDHLDFFDFKFFDLVRNLTNRVVHHDLFIASVFFVNQLGKFLLEELSLGQFSFFLADVLRLLEVQGHASHFDCLCVLLLLLALFFVCKTIFFKHEHVLVSMFELSCIALVFFLPECLIENFQVYFFLPLGL